MVHVFVPVRNSTWLLGSINVRKQPMVQSRMDNSETLATLGTHDTQDEDNPETLATLGTQDTQDEDNPETLAILGT
jgi:hypothetical protein